MAKSVEIPSKPIAVPNSVGGKSVNGSGPEFEVLSPYTNAVIGKSTGTTMNDLNQMVKAASDDQKDWGATPMKERAQVLFKFREILLAEIETVAHRVSSECGKTLAESKAVL